MSKTSTYDRGIQATGAYAQCPWCLASQQLVGGGVMVRHGWKAHGIQHGSVGGWHTDACDGHRSTPLNQSDVDGLVSIEIWLKRAAVWKATAKQHQDSPNETYLAVYREYIGYSYSYSSRADKDVENNRAEMVARIKKMTGVKADGGVYGGGSHRDSYGKLDVQVSRKYDPEKLYDDTMTPTFRTWKELRKAAIAQCKSNEKSCREHAREIEKAIEYHKVNDTTPLVPGPKPDSPAKKAQKAKAAKLKAERDAKKAAKAKRADETAAKLAARIQAMTDFVDGLPVGKKTDENEVRNASKAAGLGKATENQFFDVFAYDQYANLKQIEYSDKYKRV